MDVTLDGRDANVRLNQAEFAERSTTLRSTPRLVTLGTHNACNAKCVFCLEGSYSRFSLQLYKDFFEARLGRYIHNAEKVTFTGFGEILWIPGIEEFLDYINETLPDTWKIFTTNGTPLRPSVVERLLRSKYAIQVSLHASHAELHEKQTLLKGEFDNVLANIENLTRLRDERDLGRQLHVVLVDVLNTGNIQDLPELIRLAWRLRVQELRAFYMTLFVPEHIDMSCFFDQERANQHVLEARRVSEKLQGASNLPRPDAFQAHLPALFERGSAEPSPLAEVCYDPWQHVYVELQGSVIPCCNWGEHIGNLQKGDELDALWNNRFYEDLRRGMGSGDPHPWCRSCIRYRGYNVNSIFSHLTNRPRQQANILREILRRGLDAGPGVTPEEIDRLAASAL